MLNLIFLIQLSKEEFNQLIDIIPILHSQNKFKQKIVSLIEKFLPTEKKKIK